MNISHLHGGGAPKPTRCLCSRLPASHRAEAGSPRGPNGLRFGGRAGFSGDFTPALPGAAEGKAPSRQKPSGFRGVDPPLAARSTFQTAVLGSRGGWGVGLLGNKCCSRVVSSPLAGFELPMCVGWSRPFRWLSSRSLGFPCFVFTSNTLVLAVERETERERKRKNKKKNYLFLMPQKPHVLTRFFGRNVEALLTPAAPGGQQVGGRTRWWAFPPPGLADGKAVFFHGAGSFLGACVPATRLSIPLERWQRAGRLGWDAVPAPFCPLCSLQ